MKAINFLDVNRQYELVIPDRYFLNVFIIEDNDGNLCRVLNGVQKLFLVFSARFFGEATKRIGIAFFHP